MTPLTHRRNVAYMSGSYGDDMAAPHVIVLVGATGDLARRKLLPGLLHLHKAGLARDVRVVGTSLDEITTDEFVELAHEACQVDSNRKVDDGEWRDFARRLSYVPNGKGPAGLAEAVEAAVASLEDETGGAEVQFLHYLSVPPKAALSAVSTLGEAGLVERARIIMEKPFGVDYESAVSLNHELHQVFDEDQIFRIDHFLGKEAAQNILAFRFANGLFEPIWHRNNIDHVQIDVPETLGLEGREAFYEATGAYKDMVVTHLFQVMAFMAMEPPTSLDPGPIGEEKNKVFRSMRPIEPHHVVRGQFAGYRDRDGVSRDSDTETFVALRAEIDNWRWAGVPFFLRTGKKLAEGARIISIAFKEPPRTMFPMRLRRRRAGSGPPDLRPGGLLEDVVVVLRQATRAGDEARQAQHAVRAARVQLRRRHARGLRTPDPRRDAR